MKYLISVVSILLLSAVFSGALHSAPRIESAEKVLKGGCLADYRSKYRKLGRRKAFAVASDESGKQVCSWRKNDMWGGPANYDALKACEKRKAKRKMLAECVVVDTDGKLVVEQGVLPEWPVPGYEFPVGRKYVELHDKAMAVVEGRACQRSFRRYILYGGFKAFAYTVSERGFYSVCAFYSKTTPGLSEKLALDRCNEKRKENIYSDTQTPECKLFAKNNEILLSRNDYDMPPYEHNSLTSARRLHLNTIKTYVEGGADLNQRDKRGRTVLYYSVETNRLDVVRYLVGKGADVNLAANNGNTPLTIANKRKYRDIAKYLKLKGALETIPAEPETNTAGIASELLTDLRPVSPTMDPGTKLTNDLIDQFLATIPPLESPLNSLQTKIGNKKQVDKIMGNAVFEGEMLRTVVAIAIKVNEAKSLEAEVKKAGFQSLEDWAYIGDRIFSVVMVNELTSLVASIASSDKEFKEITNVFEFIADETRPAKIRTDLKAEIEKSCAEACVVPEDLAVVGARIDEVAAVFENL